MIKAWIAYMKEMGYTQTTIGFYLRAIRVVFKACISNGYMREKDYPFSATDPMKVKIPSGSSRKAEFLTVGQMTELYEFYTDGIIPKTYKHPEQMKQSLGMFLAQYLCNGCNLYDLALLRYEDYYDFSEHKALRFYRHKTKDHWTIGLHQPRKVSCFSPSCLVKVSTLIARRPGTRYIKRIIMWQTE